MTFECNEGFYLQGDRRRMCGLEGRWDIPEYGYTECLREFHYYFSSFILPPPLSFSSLYLKMNIYLHVFMIVWQIILNPCQSHY